VAIADENNAGAIVDDTWLLYDLKLSGADMAVTMEYGIAKFPGLTLNIPGTNVYLKAYCLEQLDMTVTSDTYINVEPLATIEAQIAAAATAQMPTGFGWTSKHNEMRNEYIVSAGVLTSTDSLTSKNCISDTNNCHDNWEGDFAVIAHYDERYCRTDARLYEDYVKVNSCEGEKAKRVK